MAVKTLDEIRDELADKHLAFIGAEAHFEYRIYNAGFNAGVAEMKKRNQVLVDCLNRSYPGEYGATVNMANQEALQQYKESVGE